MITIDLIFRFPDLGLLIERYNQFSISNYSLRFAIRDLPVHSTV